MGKNKKQTPSRKKTEKKRQAVINKFNYDRKHPKESPIKATFTPKSDENVEG